MSGKACKNSFPIALEKTESGGTELIRNRYYYGIFLLITVIIGLLSRSFASSLPGFIFIYAGDTLWALAFYFLFAILFYRRSPYFIASLTYGFSLLIEIYQLPSLKIIDFPALWKPLGYIFGYGFLWHDLVSYLAGTAVGLVTEVLLLRNAKRKIESK